MWIIRHFASLCFVSSCLLAVSISGCVDAPLPTESAATTPLPAKSTPAEYASENYAVYPPFSKNKKFIISQGFNSGRTHKGELNGYAVDFAMPVNEPVCAAKAGVVESYNDTDKPMSDDQRYREDNFVRIQHADGTWGLYTHLLPASITVKPRQEVQLGECFARVGKTGRSTGPHLHFALLKLLPDRFISVPFRFVQPDGQVLKPKYLSWITN